MRYDSSPTALFHPETLDPLTMETTWGGDAIAAEISRLAYFPIETDTTALGKVEAALAQVGFGDVHRFAATHKAHAILTFDPRGFAAINEGGHAVIAFRGTRPKLLDSLSDVLVRLVPWPGGAQVHAGFAEVLQLLLPDVETWFKRVKPRTLLITGHSLGGAMATLLASLYLNAELVTFGSPRVGNGVFADLFTAAIAQGRVRRYVDDADVVTHLPIPIALPLLPSLSYRHTGGLQHINERGVINAGPDNDEGGLIADIDALRLFRANIWDSVPLPRWLTDHAPINYVSAIGHLRT